MYNAAKLPTRRRGGHISMDPIHGPWAPGRGSLLRLQVVRQGRRACGPYVKPPESAAALTGSPHMSMWRKLMSR